MIRYSVVPLADYIQEFGETSYYKLINDFKVEKDNDVQNFLNNHALSFDRENIGKTYLIINVDWANEENRNELAGYFTLANNKAIDVSDMTKSAKRRFFGSAAGYIDRNQEGAFLIGQLARNDKYNKNELPGDIILKEIYLIISNLVEKAGGRIIVLECKEELRTYYESKGFRYIKTNSQELNILIRRTDEIKIVS